MAVDISGDFSFWKWCLGKVRTLAARLMPAPKFFAPSPEMHRADESDWQWFHIPVSVNRAWPRRDIPCCRASVVFIKGALDGQEFSLRWRSDSPSGSSETTLVYGKKRMLPLISRRDGSPAATLTDNDFLMHTSGSYSLAGISGEYVILGVKGTPRRDVPRNLTPGVHRARIKIVSGYLDWQRNDFKISVPEDGAGNSHFTVTMDQ